MRWITSTASRAFCVAVEGGDVRYRQVSTAHASRLEEATVADRSTSAAGVTAPCDGDGVATTGAAVLADIERAHRRREVAPWVPLVAVFVLYLAATAALGLRLPAIGIALAVVGALVVMAAVYFVAYRFDHALGSMHLVYHLDAEAAARYLRLQRGVRRFAGASRVWHVPSEGRGSDERRKYGAHLFLRRYSIRPELAAPPHVRTNLRVPTIYGEHRKYYFLPDRVVVFDERSVRSLAYATLAPKRGEGLCIEDEAVPFDARVVESAWLHATADGAPDPRFANNRRYPVVLYGELEFAGPSAVRELFVFSQPGAADDFVEALDVAAWGSDDEPSFGDSPAEPEVDAGPEMPGSEPEAEPDELYEDALRAVVRAGQATLEILVAEFRIEFGRAARLLAEMERDGYVGQAYRHQPRAVNRSAVRFVELRFGGDGAEDREARERRRRPRRQRRGSKRDAHDVLGVREGATREEIVAAFKELAQLYHPDKVAALAPEFQELADVRMKEINAAYNELIRSL